MRLLQWTALTPAGAVVLWDAATDIPVGWAQSPIAAPDASVVYIVRLAATDPVFVQQVADARSALLAKVSGVKTLGAETLATNPNG